jgi:cytochrome c oxidase subunit 2
MLQGIPIHPEQASSIARDVDLLHYVLTAITLFFTSVIFLIIFYFMVRYRRRFPDERPLPIDGSLPLEVAWTLIPTLICVIIFLWSSSLYFLNAKAPDVSPAGSGCGRCSIRRECARSMSCMCRSAAP